MQIHVLRLRAVKDVFIKVKIKVKMTINLSKKYACTVSPRNSIRYHSVNKRR